MKIYEDYPAVYHLGFDGDKEVPEITIDLPEELLDFVDIEKMQDVRKSLFLKTEFVRPNESPDGFGFEEAASVSELIFPDRWSRIHLPLPELGKGRDADHGKLNPLSATAEVILHNLYRIPELAPELTLENRLPQIFSVVLQNDQNCDWRYQRSHLYGKVHGAAIDWLSTVEEDGVRREEIEAKARGNMLAATNYMTGDDYYDEWNFLAGIGGTHDLWFEVPWDAAAFSSARRDNYSSREGNLTSVNTDMPRQSTVLLIGAATVAQFGAEHFRSKMLLEDFSAGLHNLVSEKE